MSSHPYTTPPYARLLRAASENNIRELQILLDQEPYLFSCNFRSLVENPLHVACKYGSLQFVEEVIKISPELARKRCQNGFSPMHIASANGHIEIVLALATFDRNLCLMEDFYSRIPLHMAAMKGKDNVVRALVFAYPETLHQVTCQEETALHLAVKNSHCVTVRVLVEVIIEFKFQELLNWKDNEGNTILHVAASKKFLEILELLLSLNSENGVIVNVNLVNGRGYTALDAHYETSSDTVARKIRRILIKAGAREGNSLQNKIGHGQQERIFLSENNLSLMVFVMIATLIFTALSSPPIFSEKEMPQKNAPVYFFDMLLNRGSEHATKFFYFMVFNIAGFMASMGAILVITWPLSFGNVLILPSAAIGIVFIILVEKSMLHFSVIVGSSQVSIATCVWASAPAFIGCGVIIMLLIGRFAVFTNGASRRNGILQTRADYK